MKRHYNGKIDVGVWGGPNGILEVVPKGISKASGLNHLLKVLDIPLENLIAFGDEHNDIEMFKLAPQAYAMKNASASSLLTPVKFFLGQMMRMGWLDNSKNSF